jgi:hypothetical protein
MEVLLQTIHVRVTVDRARKFVRHDRSPTPFDSVATFDEMLQRSLDVLWSIDRPHYALLVDLRLGPIRSGDDFEPSALRFRSEVFRDFGRAAVLVGTQVGKLQVTRHEKEHAGGPAVFVDEEEALKYLGVGG